MFSRVLCVFLLCFLLNGEVKAQDYISPVGHPVSLSGTFCELRTNHFHHGLDIRSSKGVIGDPIYAIGDGRIHRLRVQAAGYGYSVYIRHPEGYVSVYGHLSEFNEELDSIVRAFQYKLEQFEVDIYCDSLDIRVEQGEQIGNMGSSGYSFGPHLHFEIRDAETEVTINPLKFGFEVEDDVAPDLPQIRLDFLNRDGRKYHEAVVSVSDHRIQPSNSIRIDTDSIYAGSWRCGIALRTRDRMQNSRNRNGVYTIEIEVDSQLIYRFRGDSIHFDESRGVNILKDTEAYEKRRERWYLAYGQPGNPLDQQVLFTKDNGWIKTFLHKPRKVDISISDYQGNRQFVSFVLIRDSVMVDQTSPNFNYYFPYDEPNIIRMDDLELNCPTGAFYRDELIAFDRVRDQTPGYMSDVLSIRGSKTPFHVPCILSFKLNGLDSTMIQSAILLNCDEEKSYNVGGGIAGEEFRALINNFGDYVLYYDNEVPEFQVIRFPNELQNGVTIKLKIKDQFVSKGSAREIQYRATIDGHWVPMGHDAKSDTCFYEMRDLAPGSHLFEITYYDHAGNMAYWKKNFVIK